jgi:hypothetical protein
VNAYDRVADRAIRGALCIAGPPGQRIQQTVGIPDPSVSLSVVSYNSVNGKAKAVVINQGLGHLGDGVRPWVDHHVPGADLDVPAQLVDVVVGIFSSPTTGVSTSLAVETPTGAVVYQPAHRRTVEVRADHKCSARAIDRHEPFSCGGSHRLVAVPDRTPRRLGQLHRVMCQVASDDPGGGARLDPHRVMTGVCPVLGSR